jgi:hypothetical protein
MLSHCQVILHAIAVDVAEIEKRMRRIDNGYSSDEED